MELRPDELRMAYDEAVERGPGWSNLVETSLDRLPVAREHLLEAAGGWPPRASSAWSTACSKCPPNWPCSSTLCQIGNGNRFTGSPSLQPPSSTSTLQAAEGPKPSGRLPACTTRSGDPFSSPRSGLPGPARSTSERRPQLRNGSDDSVHPSRCAESSRPDHRTPRGSDFRPSSMSSCSAGPLLLRSGMQRYNIAITACRVAPADDETIHPAPALHRSGLPRTALAARTDRAR